MDAMDEGETGLPASIEAAWGRRARPSKGPRPGLSLERIVDAAVQVAAHDGLEAVSMSRVAAELDSSPMSLYRYVAAKDELLALMGDAVMADALADPSESDDGWRAGLSRWAWAYHAVLLRHPWVVRVPISAPPVTPNVTLWLERGLGTLRDTGLTEPEKLSLMLLVSGYVRNDAALAADIGAASAASGVSESQIMPRWGEVLARLTDPARFPALHAALASDAFAQDDDPDDEFAFGLERILDGIAALVAERDTGRDGELRR